MGSHQKGAVQFSPMNKASQEKVKGSHLEEGVKTSFKGLGKFSPQEGAVQFS